MKRTLPLLTIAILAGLSTGLTMNAVLAQDSTSTTTTSSSTTTTKKENPLKKAGGAMEHDTSAVVKDTGKGVKKIGSDTEKGFKAVGTGTEKGFKAVGHGMGKMIPHPHKKVAPATTPAASTTTTP